MNDQVPRTAVTVNGVPVYARVQGDGHIQKGQPGHVPGSVLWSEHLAAFEAYSKRYGISQSALTIHERGGFGYQELQMFLGRDPESWEPL